MLAQTQPKLVPPSNPKSWLRPYLLVETLTGRKAYLDRASVGCRSSARKRNCAVQVLEQILMRGLEMCQSANMIRVRATAAQNVSSQLSVNIESSNI